MGVVDDGVQIYGQEEGYYVVWCEQVMRVSPDAGDGEDGMVNHPVAPLGWNHAQQMPSD
jgi:hypothetical protein